jgi:2-isopropylmalate synthase
VSSLPIHKYKPYETVDLPDRRWPSRTIDRAPRWCSVDLRDGNQALIEPMGLLRKRRMFDLLVRLGFKEIEVGFPSASQPDFDFVRSLIDEGRIPSDVTIQVITQAREQLIDRTMEAVAGAPHVIVHLYNSVSTLQRRVVFGLDRPGIVEIATRATARIKGHAQRLAPTTRVQLEYSPESFTGTELDFAKEICEAVMDVWEPTPDNKFILNLPSTVEMSTPNVFADRVEWFDRTIARRDCLVLSVHPHNDRGTGTATAELSLLAGAERLEGCLLGNGERTGNLDIVNVALNMFSHGVDPELELGDIAEIVETVEYCNRLPVSPRHPYAGELVFTSFSGSHQDAIKKGFAARAERGDVVWEVPYLPIDPMDIGRSYEAVVRINSQSGKGGVAYVMFSDFGYDLPRALQVEFAATVQAYSEAHEIEVSPAEIGAFFEREYLTPDGSLLLRDHHVRAEGDRIGVTATVAHDGVERTFAGFGVGPIEAFVNGFAQAFGCDVRVDDYHEHALGAGAHAHAVAYVTVRAADATFIGVGRDPDIVAASFHAILSAMQRAFRAQENARVAIAV